MAQNSLTLLSQGDREDHDLPVGNGTSGKRSAQIAQELAADFI